ncbi:hypothetical protein B0T10DRAFT_557012 [Thelonectria olida]|uniref:Uncharacterized protein n=1 Tax=Thelonectria olida TaxID=1576542 RepID=A0A9P8WGR6_9HYPO|nr:hypothetical protein B0T10DRAFT_557012 [Thelonectria olida]
MSLAQRSAEDVAEGVADDNHDEEEKEEVVQMQETRTIEHGRTTDHTSYRQTEAFTEIHNPKPQLAPDHICSWRTRYMDLSTEVDQLKSEASSRKQQEQTVERPIVGRSDVGVGTDLDQHQCPEIRIEGLTIVMHMRGKDDLVINTNLKKDGIGTGHKRR